MSAWTLIYEEFDPEQERLRESLCTLGNGYFATRGAAPEIEASTAHYPGTYLAGGYNRLETEIAGRVIGNEDLVNMPNSLFMQFRPKEGDWFDFSSGEVLLYRQELNSKEGLLSGTLQFRDKKGRGIVRKMARGVYMDLIRRKWGC